VISQESEEDGPARGETYDDAFERLFVRAYQASFQLLRSREEAEDVAMDTMARALQHWKELDPVPDGWVTRVATNRSIDVWRKAQRRREHDQLARLTASDYQIGDGLDLRQALCKLPRRQREVVALRYFLDLSEREIADSLGCSVGSVKQHASRGLAALRRELKGEEVSFDD
jgi:RNA polymerase sigma factor (sigma-70 family)